MATTAIWNVKGWLGQVTIYVQNPEKTQNPKYFENRKYNQDEIQGLSDVIDYATSDKKVRRKYHITDEINSMPFFTSSINCSTITARDEMLAVKERFGKKGGNVAYHGYQSFKPGECTPETAHEIGVKMANELWGERFQVIVATHTDQEHTHNHFVINSVSFLDGKKYNDCKDSYLSLIHI